jgi:hypothetical protein
MHLRPLESLRCLIVCWALACGEEGEPVRLELARLRQAAVTALRERIERAVRDGDLPEGTDCATLVQWTPTQALVSNPRA